MDFLQMDGNRNYLIKKFILGLAFGLILQSCLSPEQNSVNQSGQASSNISSTNTETTEKTPPTSSTQTSSINYFQNGSTKASNNFLLDINSTNTIFFRGKEINNHISTNNKNTNACLLISFNSDSLKKVLIVTAAPNSYRNFSDNTIEYYYSLSPHDETLNKSHCQGGSIITKVFTEYSGQSIVFKLTDVCEDCFNTTIKSSAVEILTKEGKGIDGIKDHYLGLSLYSNPESDVVFGNSCSTTLDCTRKGFDCCSLGQCVNDKTPKPGVAEIDEFTGAFINFSSQYAQVEADLLANPSHIYNYPHLFYLCGQAQDTDSAVVQEHNEEEKAYYRFRELQELYNCTTQVQGEQSICVKRYYSPTSRELNLITGADDITFEGTYSGTAGMPNHSITKIIHAEETLFEDNEILVSGSVGINGNAGEINRGNDNFDDVVTITLNNTLTSNSEQLDELAIYYRTDGSCEYINSYLAKCKKYYHQGENIGETTDHYPASNYFKLPFYADTSRMLTVTVDDVPKIESLDWEDYADSDRYIRFFKFSDTAPDGKDFSTLHIFDGQKIVIQFYVDLNQHNVGVSKYEALDRIDEICQCGGPNCKLQEVFSTSTGEVIDYRCIYPPGENNLKFEQKVIVSSKSIPQRYFDEDGLGHDTISINTPKQEESNKDSVTFEYTRDDPVRPNNVDQFIGFNEINGTISYDNSSAHPPTVVELEKGTMYDIFVDQGTFNTCISCGNDYYARFIKNHPDSFFNLGAGYRSKGTETDPFRNTDYRMDDLLFGRACFVPATMIPFTHDDDSIVQDQRFSRQAAQHFLFANGYQRDWYGFDYGSIIGSFDGVTWFSVGSQRRIKADSHRLYLAVNSYFGDLNRSNVFVVHINEASLIVSAGSQITSDDDSNGTSCREFHQCEVDSDCVTQLGWDYVCEDIEKISTVWPEFNSYGQELPTNDPQKRLFKEIFYGKEIGNRCVYRGRGAPCETDINKTSDNTYSSIDVENAPGLHMCAPNYHCAEINNNSLFNNRIVRYARSPAFQNASEDVDEEDLDLIGKGARILGRPFKYNGDEEVYLPEAYQNLRNNNVTALCLPGKDPRTSKFGTTYFEQHSFIPTDPSGIDSDEFFMGDQIGGIGMTMAVQRDEENFLSCGIFDSDGNYYHKEYPNEDLTGGSTTADEILAASHTQATTTNMLSIFEGPDYTDSPIIKNFDTEFIEEFYFQKNRCLRMPGSPCFNNLDCAMNEKIVDKNQVVNASTDDSLTGADNLNRYEVAFWQSEMICGQRMLKDDEDYELKNNRCCRDHDNTFLWAQEAQRDSRTPSSNEPEVNLTNVPGFDFDMSQTTRNSQVALYKDFFDDRSTHLGAVYPSTDGCEEANGSCGCTSVSDTGCFNITTQIGRKFGQWRTLQSLGKKMCCSQNWVRNFHAEIGGGHEWSVDKNQLIPSENFTQINWLPKYHETEEEELSDIGFNLEPFTCKGLTATSTFCMLRGMSDILAASYEDFLSRFDLLGIPQIPIPALDSDFAQTFVKVDEEQRMPDLNGDSNEDFIPIPGTIKTFHNTADTFNSGSSLTHAKDNAAFKEGNNYYYSADSDLDIWEEDHNLKKIYSRDEFTCCLPPNSVIENDGDPSQCCSGYAEDIKTATGTERTCKLKDLTDITQLLNKYVSSLGEEIGIEESNFDEITGNLDMDKFSMDNLISLVCQADICGSRVVATGLAHGLYTTPGIENDDSSIQLRFIQSENEKDVGGLYESGLKWKTHLYCFPMERNDSSGQPSCNPSIDIPEQLLIQRCDCD